MAEAYVTVSEATAYLETRLNTQAWDTADYKTQQQAVFEATRLIDALRLNGTKAVADQVLRFPRAGQLALDTDESSPTYNTLIPTVPTDVKEACCDIALALLQGIDPTHEYNLLSRKIHGYAATRQEKDTAMVEPHIVAGIPSLEAWKKLVKYIRTYQRITLGRDS